MLVPGPCIVEVASKTAVESLISVNLDFTVLDGSTHFVWYLRRQKDRVENTSKRPGANEASFKLRVVDRFFSFGVVIGNLPAGWRQSVSGHADFGCPQAQVGQSFDENRAARNMFFCVARDKRSQLIDE